jgi:hypothetical protein
VLFEDARALGVADATVDVIMTSPPYVGAQKYVRASSLCLESDSEFAAQFNPWRGVVRAA